MKLKRLSAAERKQRRIDAHKKRKDADARIKQEFGLDRETFELSSAAVAALLANDVISQLPAAERDGFKLSDAFVTLIDLTRDDTPPRKMNPHKIRELVWTLATGRDQSWRDDPLVLLFFKHWLEGYLFPKTGDQQQREQKEIRAEAIQGMIQEQWECGEPVGKTKDALVAAGDFESLDALDKFLERYGK
jgi:hypothetical protein